MNVEPPSANSVTPESLCDKSQVAFPESSKHRSCMVLGSLSSSGFHVSMTAVNAGAKVVAVESVSSVPISDTVGTWHDHSVILSGHAHIDMVWRDYCNQTTLQALLQDNRPSHIVYVPDLTSVGVKSAHLHGTLVHCAIDILEAMKEFSTVHLVLVLSVNISSGNDDRVHQVAAAEILESALAAYGHLYHYPMSVVYMPISNNGKSSDLANTVDAMFSKPGYYLCEVVSLRDTYLPDSVAHTDANAKDRIVFTSYFTSSVDPQRARKRKANYFQYMKTWYDSVNELDLHAIVFYDDLSQSFVDKLSNQNVMFRQVLLNEHSTNDARFYVWYQYLLDHPSISHILLTDISDVEFLKDPFHLMDLLGDWLYIGQDIDLFPNMESMPWLMTRLRQCFGDESVDHGEISRVKKLHLVYNAGIIGGPRGIVLTFLHRVINILDSTPSHLNCNMAVVNYVAHKFFDDYIFAGFPLTSRFMAKQSNPKAVYIIHK